MPVSTSSSSWPTGTRSSPLALTRCGTAWVQGSYEVLFGAPNANGIAERWVRTVRSGCADRLVIVNERHLRRVLDCYVRHYNQHRPHRGLAMDAPVPRGNAASSTPAKITRIRRHEVLGGLINEYHAARAARTGLRNLRPKMVSTQLRNHIRGRLVAHPYPAARQQVVQGWSDRRVTPCRRTSRS